MRSNGIRTFSLIALALLAGTAFHCPSRGVISFQAPLPQQLSETGDVEVEIRLLGFADPADLTLELDGNDVSAALVLLPDGAEATLSVPDAGWHELVARVPNPGGMGFQESVAFETVELADADVCETLNAVECLLPYPSDLFRQVQGGSAKLAFPQVGMPAQDQGGIPTPLPASMLEVRDGFNPTAQILTHFPQQVDLAASGAARLLAEPNRSTDLTSLSEQSPTVLLRKSKHFWKDERVLHWLENDARVDDPDILSEGVDPFRRVLFLRPGRSLEPAGRYIVAFRNLMDVDGNPVEAEPVFAALRDGRPTTIPAVEARRSDFEELFFRLWLNGVQRHELVLAWDFTIASDENLTGQMLSMRDQALDWLAGQDQDASPTFTAAVEEFDCSAEGQHTWRKVTGVYQVPLFLDMDPVVAPDDVGFLVVGPDGFTPVWSTTTNPTYGISIPCEALDGPVTSLVVGHGLFGDGPSFGRSLNDSLGSAEDTYGVVGPSLIAGATHWRGLSNLDVPIYIALRVALSLKDFATLPDRLRQGVTNQLVLAEMMRLGAFNGDPAFQAPPEHGGHGVFDPSDHYDYFGVSLGGVMGTFFAAVAPHLRNANVDVPGINFSLLVQRARPFQGPVFLGLGFQDLLDLSVGFDPMTQILGLGMVQELWTSGEPSGYATHVSDDRLPGSGPAPNVLMTMAFLDHQVSNQATEISARTLDLPSLDGSLLSGLPLIPDQAGPLSSALVVYDTGALVIGDPNSEPLIPPLTNQAIKTGPCDPHARRGQIPASLMQLGHFLSTGEIVNFCDGLCDADPSVVDIGPEGNLFELETVPDDPGCPPGP